MAQWLVLFIALLPVGCEMEPDLDPKRPDLILITIDTLRADHLDLHGYARPTAPNLEKLGRTGIVFEHAVASAPWTLPSMASIHTGLLPSEHGAVDSGTPIHPHHPTLATRLKEHGYETHAVVSHVFVGSKFGFARGFDAFNERHLQGHDGSSSAQLTKAALEQFGSRGDGPAFLWVHYFDPHYSYERHPEYEFATGPKGRFGDAVVFLSPEGTEYLNASPDEAQYMLDVYDEEIAHTDHHVASLIDGVREASRGRPTVFVVTADHGEAFHEHGRLGHGKDVYDEMVRVPLIIGGDVPAGMSGRSTPHPVETASIASTLLILAGIDTHGFNGSDLLATARGEASPPYVFSEGSYARAHDQRKVSVDDGRWKLIVHQDEDRRELYDRQSDPGENENLIDAPGVAQIRASLLAALNARDAVIPSQTKASDPADLSDAERRKLEALGYIEPTGGADD